MGGYKNIIKYCLSAERIEEFHKKENLIKEQGDLLTLTVSTVFHPSKEDKF